MCGKFFFCLFPFFVVVASKMNKIKIKKMRRTLRDIKQKKEIFIYLCVCVCVLDVNAKIKLNIK